MKCLLGLPVGGGGDLDDPVSLAGRRLQEPDITEARWQSAEVVDRRAACQQAVT